MASLDILAKVVSVVADELDKTVEEVTRDKKFVDDLGADSLDTVELIMRLEETFEIEIQDNEAEKITSVGEAADYIEKALSAKSSS